MQGSLHAPFYLVMDVQRGLKEAKEQAELHAAQQEKEKQGALAGKRPALPSAPPSDPGAELEAAEQLYKAQPSMEATKANRVEVNLSS